jgi:hypothetical protein
MRRHSDALFLFNTYGGFKFWPSLIDSVGMHVHITFFYIFVRLLLVLNVKVVALLDVHQLQI